MLSDENIQQISSLHFSYIIKPFRRVANLSFNQGSAEFNFTSGIRSQTAIQSGNDIRMAWNGNKLGLAGLDVLISKGEGREKR